MILVPQLDKAYVRITPPAYTGLKAEEKPYAFKGVQALAGSEVRFRLQSNRPLREGALEVTTGDAPPQVVKLALSSSRREEAPSNSQFPIPNSKSEASPTSAATNQELDQKSPAPSPPANPAACAFSLTDVAGISVAGNLGRRAHRHARSAAGDPHRGSAQGRLRRDGFQVPGPDRGDRRLRAQDRPPASRLEWQLLPRPRS